MLVLTTVVFPDADEGRPDDVDAVDSYRRKWKEAHTPGMHTLSLPVLRLPLKK